MMKRTESDLDNCLEQLDLPAPASFVSKVMDTLDKSDLSNQRLTAVEAQANKGNRTPWRLRPVLDALLMLIGGLVGLSQGIAFVFGAWSVTTLG